MSGQGAHSGGLAVDHQHLVKRIASDIRHRYRLSIELEELEAAGLEGLVQAERSYSPSRGIAFSTFAYYRIRGAILDNCRSLGFLKRQYAKKARFEVAANEVLSSAATTVPSTPPGPADSSWIGEAFDGLMAAFMLNEGALEWVRDKAPSPEKRAEVGELKKRLTECLKSLTDEERDVLHKFYFDNERMTKIATDFGVSLSWVSRVHTRALQKLRPMILAGDDVKPP